MKPLSQQQYILNFIKKLRLKSAYFRIFTYIFNLLKLLPIFIITHDWNVVHTKGISHYLIEFTLGPILHRINDLIFSIALLTFFLLFSIVPFIFLAIYYCKFKHYSVFLFKSKVPFQTCVWLLYIFPFLLNQYMEYTYQQPRILPFFVLFRYNTKNICLNFSYRKINRNNKWN